MKPIYSVTSSLKLGPQLDVRQQSNKTLVALRAQLQAGLLIKATIHEVTKDGKVIFSMNGGKLSLANRFSLHKGDKITVKLFVEKGQLLGIVSTINNVKNKSTQPQPLQLFFTRSLQSNYLKEIKQEEPFQRNINASNAGITQDILKIKVIYLNLSSINKNSLIYKVLSKINTGASMELKIVSDPNRQALSPYQIAGESIRESGNNVLIKVPFGIISSGATQLPLGKNLILEIKSVNDVNLDNRIVLSHVKDFLFNINRNWLIFQNILDIFKNTTTINPKSNNYSTKATENISSLFPGNSQLENNEIKGHKTIIRLLNSPEIKNPFKELSDSFIKLKLFFATNIQHGDYTNWQVFFIPIWDGEKIVNSKIFIKHNPSEFIRFVIDISLKILGEIQIDGLIKSNTKQPPINFDLIVRFKGSLNKEIQNQISEIFLLHQNLGAVRGTLNFQQVENFKFNPGLEN